MAKSRISPQIIPSFTNGISQQASAARLLTQVQAAVNIRSSVVAGSGPRTGTKHIAFQNISTYQEGPPGSYTPEWTAWDWCYPALFDRGSQGLYGVLVTGGNMSGGNIEVWNLKTGVKCPVAYPSGRAYLPSSYPAVRMRHVAAGDYLFFTNKTKTVAMKSTKSPVRQNDGYIFARAGNYQDIVTVILTNHDTATSMTWKIKFPGTAAGASPLASENICIALQTILETNAPPAFSTVQSDSSTANYTVVTNPASTATAAGYTISRYLSVLRITRSDGAKFTVRCQDQDNSKKVYSIQRTVSKFTDLPARFFGGAVIEVAADASKGDTNYWVEYVQDTNTSASDYGGYWRECPAPDTFLEFDNTTMPWALKATGTDTFEFSPLEWDERPIGSNDTIPQPSFVGQKINDLFFVGGRLGFVFFDGVSTSRSGDRPFNFWRETSTDVLDTDPIDIINGGSDTVEYHSCVQVGDEVVLFSNASQAVLMTPSGESLRPQVAELKTISKYQTEATPPNYTVACPPLSYGDRAFYIAPGTTHSSVNEFVIAGGNDRAGTSQDISSHVPSLIQNPAWQMAACTSENLVFVVSGTHKDLYVYEFLDTPDQGRAQSAWNLWTFGNDCKILGVFASGTTVYLMLRRGDQFFLESMDVGANRLTGRTADFYLMDQKVDANNVERLADTVDGSLQLTLPFGTTDTDGWYYVTRGSDGYGRDVPVNIYPLTCIGSGVFKTPPDVDPSTNYYVGRVPRVYLEPSEPLHMGPNGPTFMDCSVVAVGPILGNSLGLSMRVASKRRRNYAKLMTIGQPVERPMNATTGLPANALLMELPQSITPGRGEYVYILSSDVEEAVPKRFYKIGFNASDVLVAFENNGPIPFRIMGMVWQLSARGSMTGL